ncbi:ATP-binding protein [Amycolatopsis sp. 195334CR]|uniref:ATP-binding protein n=1 Tax=Amycolatopsis sp. 195334CR TaxID=2814588 RepID=UPI001A8E8305|nr:ATP-binding protein [Amycolatopsis sp. 195334CR]MBN6036863.1 ATP-binding protein [Amycolatopsis sp. 195334CR]
MRRSADAAGQTLGNLATEVDLLPPLPPATAVLHHREQATAENASRLRGALARWLRDLGLGGDLHEDVVLAAYEAMANVVDHAYAGPAGPLELHGHATATRCTITITDRGRWRRPRTVAGSFRGRGLGMMHELADEVLMRSNALGTTIRMSWWCALTPGR